MEKEDDSRDSAFYNPPDLGYLPPGGPRTLAQQVRPWRAIRKVLARVILLVLGIFGTALCLSLVHFDTLDAENARYVKGGLTAASTLIQFAVQSSLVGIVAARGIYERTTLSRVMAMGGQISWMDALGAKDALLVAAVSLDAAFAIGMSYVAGGSIGTVNETITTTYTGWCDPEIWSKERTYNFSAAVESNGDGNLFLKVLSQAKTIDDPNRNIGGVNVPIDSSIYEVGTYLANASCTPIIDVNAFNCSYNTSNFDIETGQGMWNGSWYGSIGQAGTPTSGGGAIYVGSKWPYPSINYKNDSVDLIIQYHEMGTTTQMNYSTTLSRSTGNETVNYGPLIPMYNAATAWAYANTQYLKVIQFACKIPLFLGKCQLSRNGLSGCISSYSRLQVGSLGDAWYTDQPNYLSSIISNGAMLETLYWSPEVGSPYKGLLVDLDNLEHQLSRMVVNSAYAYGNVAHCQRSASVPFSRIGLVLPNVYALVGMIVISIFVVLAHLFVVISRAPAFGTLGSGLDIARTVAQSDYLQDITQGRCAESDVNPPVALSFTPVQGQPGHIHFVPPGTATPWVKGHLYAGA